MMTVKQVSVLTGVSVRTLQFYDEIGLLKPAQVSEAGYRMYDEPALETLQQILFFKELDFTLREIKRIMEDPHFDRRAALVKQKELIALKRDRLNGLIELLDRELKGEESMEFNAFDMSEYFRVLTGFKKTHTDEIIKNFGSIEQFDRMVSGLRAEEGELAEHAARIYGSVEEFTRAMGKNFEKHLTQGPELTPEQAKVLIAKTETLTKMLTEDLGRDPASPEVQAQVAALIVFVNECSRGNDMGVNYWSFMAESYTTSPSMIETNDKKYGAGASQFIGRAIIAYLNRQQSGASGL